MPYLDAALAFALTMLAVATLVTQLVRLLQYFAKTRSTVMKELLIDYFNKELKPVVTRELDRLKGQVKTRVTEELSKHITDLDKIAAEAQEQVEKFGMIATDVSKYADALKFVVIPKDASGNDAKKDPPTKMRKLLQTLTKELGLEKPANVEEHPLFKDVNWDKLVDVSIEEMIEYLKRSDMGKKLLEELGDKANTVFDELGKQYNLVGKKFTLSFRKYSRIWATIVALLLALFLNIDTVFIVKTYITNEGMRQAVIAQQGALEEAHTSLQDKLQEDEGKETVTKEELEQVFTDTQEQLDTFTSAGFPVGWSYYPYGAVKKVGFQGLIPKLEYKEFTELSKEFTERNNTLGWWMWVVGCVLTGLLAGLGGPFWYDVVAGISHAAKSVRGQKN